MESTFVFVMASNSSDNDSSDWHFLGKVIISLIAELIETGSNCAVVTNLDEAACLSDIDDKTDG